MMDIEELLDLSNYVESDILNIKHFHTFFKPISKTEDVNDYLLDPTIENLRMLKETHYLRVWSMFESEDSDLFILPGFRKNAIKYIITEENWDTEENNIVIYN